MEAKLSMSNTGRIFLMGSLLSGLVVISMPAALASCAPPIPIEQALADADFVFVGTVGDVEHEARVATVAVTDVWKGEVQSKVLVSGGPTLSELESLGFGESVITSVDRYFDSGVTYLFVSYLFEDGAYMDNSCSATQVYDESLDVFRPETAHPPIAGETDPSSNLARTALAVAGVVATGAFVFLRARRRRLPSDVS